MTDETPAWVPMVIAIATKQYNKIPRYLYVELNDMIADGFLACVEAAPRYDLTNGVQCLSQRVHGAIVDGLRQRSGYMKDRRRRKFEYADNTSLYDDDVDMPIIDLRENVETEACNSTLVQQVLADATVKQREAMLMVLAGFRHCEIAPLLGVTDEAVWHRLRDAGRRYVD